MMDNLILKERETREKIAEIVNKSKLPGFCLKSIFKDFLTAADVLEQEQYQQAIIAKMQEKEARRGKQKNEEGRNNNS